MTTRYVTSHHVISHHITSRQITSYHVTSYHITTYHITSYHIISHHITSHRITSHQYPSLTLFHHLNTHRLAYLNHSGTHLVGGDTTTTIPLLEEGGLLGTTPLGPSYRGTDREGEGEGMLIVLSSSSTSSTSSTAHAQRERDLGLGEIHCVWGDPSEPPVDTDHPDMSYPLKMLLRRYLVREREVVPWVGVGPGGVDCEDMVSVDASVYLTDMRLCEKVGPPTTIV